jgi:hypothetical protein
MPFWNRWSGWSEVVSDVECVENHSASLDEFLPNFLPKKVESTRTTTATSLECKA